MMENEFIPYEQALALKELGFDEPSISGYSYPNSDKLLSQAILYQQAFRWFREKHGYLYHITYFDPYKAQTPGNADYQGFVLFPHAGIHKLPKMSYDTYEEAELACLIKLIEITKTK